MVGEPGETKSEHLKSYVEPSIRRDIKRHQMRKAFESESAAIRDLIITGLIHQEPAVVTRDGG